MFAKTKGAGKKILQVASCRFVTSLRKCFMRDVFPHSGIASSSVDMTDVALFTHPVISTGDRLRLAVGVACPP